MFIAIGKQLSEQSPLLPSHCAHSARLALLAPRSRTATLVMAAAALGVTVELGREVVGPDDGGWIITDRHVMRLWFAQVREGAPEPLVEHDLVSWLAPEEWDSVPWLAGDVRIVEALRQHVGAGFRGVGA